MARTATFSDRARRDLSKAVKSSGLSYRQLANRLGVCRTYLQDVVEGRRSPTIDWVDDTLKALKRQT